MKVNIINLSNSHTIVSLLLVEQGQSVHGRSVAIDQMGRKETARLIEKKKKIKQKRKIQKKREKRVKTI